MHKVNVLTLFPEMLTDYFSKALNGKALEKNIWALNPINFRDYAEDVHKTVDDTPYGGGAGMVIKCDVLEKAILDNNLQKNKFYFMSPRGKRLTQDKVKEIIKDDEFTILCGRYEGVDNRIIEAYDMEEISMGDFVLSGGELPAMAMIDACVRLLPGVMGNSETAGEESFENNLLEYSHYTKPAVWIDNKGNEHKVPEILLSGHHKNINKYRIEESEKITKQNRPDIWAKHEEIRKGY
ncbi:MAG: tRNA (guanosine(37)-N1)-methyltransferase TrmD [Alphaproteobacteria bacterium]|nr:tRNA (guanosine(37)-N1)-methyltransferase TrmD [Alphaproteobacteria bacterium]